MTRSAQRVAEDFATQLAAKNRDGLLAVLDADVDFRAMTPLRFWEGHTPESVLDAALGHWFDQHDHIEELVGVETSDMSDRTRLTYRLRVRNDDGESLVEQQAYLMENDGRITWLRIMCSGYRPVA